MERLDPEDAHGNNHCCLVAIGRLQVTSTPNTTDLGSNSSNEFISRHSIDGKFTFVDQRQVTLPYDNITELFLLLCKNFVLLFLQDLLCSLEKPWKLTISPKIRESCKKKKKKVKRGLKVNFVVSSVFRLVKCFQMI